MELPITEKELEVIIEILKNKTEHWAIYSKLWTFKTNRR